MPPLFLLCLVCLINFSVAEKSTKISYITPNLIKDIDDNVELTCSVEHTDDHPVVWLKYGENRNRDILFLSSGSALVLRDPRLALRYNQSTSTYVLGIKNIQESDAGYYKCQVSLSPNNTVSAEVELQIRRPPSISNNSTKSIEVSEAQDVQMECYAEGFPPPTISWRRENNVILPTGDLIYEGNVLKIKQIRKEDRGTYYCVAKNGVGRGQKHGISVQVEFAPVVTVPRPRLGQALQFDMDLGCHIEAYPPPAVTWEKDNVTLSNNQHYVFSNFATSDEFYDSNIRAVSIEKEQYGQYVCKAANKLGTAEGKIELFETDHPICPPACATTTSSTTTTSCTTSTTTSSAPTESKSSQSSDPESS